MSRFQLSILVSGLVLLSLAGPSQVTGQLSCDGKYKSGLKPSPPELAEILKKHAEWHAEWVREGYLPKPKVINDPRVANLCGANLIGANLIRVNLIRANLSNAHLEHADLRGAHLLAADLSGAQLSEAKLGDANLSGAQLSGANLERTDLFQASLSGVVGDVGILRANLRGANLEFANLSGAYLGEANLSDTNLHEADLSGAHLRRADFSGAYLSHANLERADLSGAHLMRAGLYGTNLLDANLQQAGLKDADMSYADVAGAFLDSDPDSLPRVVPGLYNAHNLYLVKFHDQPATLVKLRGAFKDLGLRSQESQLTYAVKRSELSRKDKDGYYVHSWSERAINTVFFDWTCQYGMSPGRPLSIAAALAVILSIVYVFAQVDPGSNGGIWAVWDEHRIKDREEISAPQQLTDGFPSGRSEIGVFMLALYFSLLSATRIGWHELNVGTWITRIQPRQYSLQATGWVRVISGIQSLISVYLVALAILSYFGTPFEY